MRLRAELDDEIMRENRAELELRKTVYRETKTRAREDRRVHIMEMWEMGYSAQEIADTVEISKARVAQIVRNFGQREVIAGDNPS